MGIMIRGRPELVVGGVDAVGAVVVVGGFVVFVPVGVDVGKNVGIGIPVGNPDGIGNGKVGVVDVVVVDVEG